MRKQVYNLVRDDDTNSLLSKMYDFLVILTIIVSLFPLAFKEENTLFDSIEKFSFIIFIIDYLLRWITSDFKLKKNKLSFLLYPFTGMAIIDLLSILPSISILNSSFRLLRVLRLFKAMRVLNMFKFFRYSKSLPLIIRVFKKEKDILAVVVGISIGYIIMSALVIFNVEPESFDTFFDAVYWATVSLTTVGYGDIYPVTKIGRVVTMFSSLFGIAIIALPASLLTAGFMQELNNEKSSKN